MGLLRSGEQNRKVGGENLVTNTNGSEVGGETKRGKVETEFKICPDSTSSEEFSLPHGILIVTQRDAALHLTVLESASLLPAEPPALLGTIHS